LNVSGIWLEQAGFGIGDQIEITVRQNELIIKPLS
jgi:bifunctional DNA-binding transcriptional regulator/antitoxin component of YhaV-PrlF toxin-antitoxin module